MLTQVEADILINIDKKREDDTHYYFPDVGDCLTIPILSIDEKEKFLIDINRKGTIKLTKCTQQQRYQRIYVLVRLDIDGAPHQNPEVDNVPHDNLIPYNGQSIPCPHIHLYIEGYMDKWAIPAAEDKFANKKDLHDILNEFFDYCHITDPPIIQRRLFT